MNAPVATPPSAPLKLGPAALATLSPEEQARLRKVQWVDRLVSLWAPVTVLALVFGVYLVVAETWVCSTLWLQPVMQVLGVVAFLWWAALVVERFVARKWDALRKARYEADELIAEVERVANKHRAELAGKGWDELVGALAGAWRGYSLPLDGLSGALKKLDGVADKQLSKFRRGGFLDFGSGFVRALAIALAFRALLVEPFKIPSGSMIPTLEIGDQIFVNKFIYGVRLPFTNYVPFVLFRKPKRGDVIVFNNPANLEVDYIKRVIGVPGDELDFAEDGTFTVNGKPFARTLEVTDWPYWDSYAPPNETLGAMFKRWTTDDWHLEPGQSLYREDIDGTAHYILEDPAQARTQTTPRMQVKHFTVPEGSVFVMGDNRNNSLDGRFGLSDGTNRVRFVPYGNIKGKATVIWLSLAHGGLFSGLFGGTGLRYDRFFRSVSLCGSEPPRSNPPRDAL